MAAARSATPATRALDRGGVAYVTHSYAFSASSGDIGLQAAVALDVDPRRILKTLVVVADEVHALAVLAVADTLDLKAMAAALGSRRCHLAPIPDAQRVTGFIKGGISPFGTRRALPTVIDSGAFGFPCVLINGGRRGLQVELAPTDIRRMTCGQRADIARQLLNTGDSF